MKYIITLLALMLLASPGVAGAGEWKAYHFAKPVSNIDSGGTSTILPCVPPDVAIQAWSDALIEPATGQITMTLECNPCKCPSNDPGACYEFRANEAREAQRKYNEKYELLDRAKKYGICTQEMK